MKNRSKKLQRCVCFCWAYIQAFKSPAQLNNRYKMLLKSHHAVISLRKCATRWKIWGLELLNLDVATLSWAMRDRPTWDQHRVPLRAKHNWFKACSELTFCCNPLRAEEEVLCLQRCSTRLLQPAVGCFFFLLPFPSIRTNPAYCLSIHWCDYRRIVPVVTS